MSSGIASDAARGKVCIICMLSIPWAGGNHIIQDVFAQHRLHRDLRIDLENVFHAFLDARKLIVQGPVRMVSDIQIITP